MVRSFVLNMLASFNVVLMFPFLSTSRSFLVCDVFVWMLFIVLIIFSIILCGLYECS